MAAKKKLIDITNKEIVAIYNSGKKATVSFIRTFVDKINNLADLALSIPLHLKGTGRALPGIDLDKLDFMLFLKGESPIFLIFVLMEIIKFSIVK